MARATLLPQFVPNRKLLLVVAPTALMFLEIYLCRTSNTGDFPFIIGKVASDAVVSLSHTPEIIDRL